MNDLPNELLTKHKEDFTVITALFVIISLIMIISLYLVPPVGYSIQGKPTIFSTR